MQKANQEWPPPQPGQIQIIEDIQGEPVEQFRSDSWDSLEDTEKLALDYFASNNNRVRSAECHLWVQTSSTDAEERDFEDKVRAIVATVQKHCVPQGTILYHAQRKQPKDGDQEDWDTYFPYKHLSTSTNESAYENVSTINLTVQEIFLWRIKVGPNVHGVGIKADDLYEGEKEIILERDLQVFINPSARKRIRRAGKGDVVMYDVYVEKVTAHCACFLL